MTLKLYPQNNPLFDMEARSLPWGMTWAALRYQSYRWVGVIVGIGLGLWSLFLLIPAASGGEQNIYAIYDTIWEGIGFLFLLSVSDKLILDFVGIASALDSISDDMQKGRWDLIVVSNFRTRQVVHAKHAVAQIRAWRMVMRVVALRLTVGVLILATLFIPPLVYTVPSGIFNPYRDIRLTTIDEYSLFFFMSAAAAVVFAIYIIEPLWRLRALSAASLAISTRQHAPGFALLAAFGAVVGIWIVQILIAIGSGFMLWFTAFSYFSGTTAGMCMVGYVGAVGIMIYSVYNGMTNRWLKKANQRLIATGGTP